MKRFVILLLVALAISIIVIAAARSSKTIGVTEAKVPVSITPPQPTGVIDGAVTPEKIPDHVAYSLVFQLIAERQTEAAKGRIKSYIREMGLAGSDVDALITTAEEFSRRVSVLNEQAAKINVRSRSNLILPSLNAGEVIQLKQLEKQRELIVTEIAASLPHRLSVAGFANLRQHINERVKRKTRILPDQETN